MKKLLENGYITNVCKGSKGNPSVIKIATIKRQLNDNNMTIKVAQPSHLEELNDNNMTIKRQLNDNLIKEKEKENNIYSDFEKIILNKYPGKKVKAIREKKVPKLLDKYSIDELTRCIERYSNECKGKDKQYILNESTFWNGRYMDYLDSNYSKEEVKEITTRRKSTNWD